MFYEQDFENKIELFFDSNIKCRICNEEVVFDLDWQSGFVCNFNEKKIYYRERGSNIEEPIVGSEYFKVEFVLLLYWRINKWTDIEKRIKKNIMEQNDLAGVGRIIKPIIDEKYYSIGSVESDKYSLIFDEEYGKYKIIYRFSDVDYWLSKPEKNEKYDIVVFEDNKENVFSKFFCGIRNASVYDAFFEKYEKIFGESFTEEEKLRLKRILK